MADEVCEFVWQCEQRKKWLNFSDAECSEINEAMKNKSESLEFPNTNPRKKVILDLAAMHQRNKNTRYERRIRCLVPNKGFFAWLYQANKNDWCSYKPRIAFHLELAYQRKEKEFKFSDGEDFKIDLENYIEVNENTGSSRSITREKVEVALSSEMQASVQKSEDLIEKLLSSDVPSAKRIRLDFTVSNGNGHSGAVALPDGAFNPMDIDDETDSAVSPATQKVPVDAECPEKGNYHIYCDTESVFSATLNQTNLQNNNNKFYLIQLLKHNSAKQFAVWRRWGRVGLRGQTDFTNYGASLDQAYKGFDKKFYEKTKNHWCDKKSFVKVAGKYELLQMDLNPVEKLPIKQVKSNVVSTLSSKVQSLLEMICDVKKMEEIMKEMSFDSNKTPLGKLTLKQVKDGYIALSKIANLLSKGGKGSELLNACNDFYTKIPHNFGMKTPPIIRTQEEIETKLKMLEALSNITVAMGVLQSKSNKAEHPLDGYYRSLGCVLVAIEAGSAEYMEIEKTLLETHGPTHTTYSMEIIDVYRCTKEKEESSFIDNENKLLLWHGSRITNWMGILKEGLRIAPPEAPITGYMFGKGVYFADVSSKSANYCFATKMKNEGLLLMCEVSIGKQHELTASDGNLPARLPKDCNSVLGSGRVNPEGFKTGPLSLEAKAPYGPLKEDSTYEGSLIYNEYIVYNVKQVKMKYLIRIKFNFK